MKTVFGRRFASAVIALHLCACAQAPSPGISEAQRSRIGAVGVAPLAMTPEDKLRVVRGRGSGAAKGAAEGALQGFSNSGNCGIGCIFVVPLFVTFGALGGGAAGAAYAVPDDKAAEIQARFKAVLTEVGDQARLQGAVVDAARHFGIPRVTAVTETAVSHSMPAAGPRSTPSTGVDSILNVGLVSVDLSGGGGEDPDLALRVVALARLVDARTGAELYRTRLYTHNVGPRKFSEWDAASSRALKDALERAYRSLGQSIVDEIFLVIRTN